MGLNVEDVIAGLDPAKRRKVEKMAAQLIAEVMTLGELRFSPPAHPGQRSPGARHWPGRRVAVSSIPRSYSA